MRRKGRVHRVRHALFHTRGFDSGGGLCAATTSLCRRFTMNNSAKGDPQQHFAIPSWDIPDPLLSCAPECPVEFKRCRANSTPNPHRSHSQAQRLILGGLHSLWLIFTIRLLPYYAKLLPRTVNIVLGSDRTYPDQTR